MTSVNVFGRYFSVQSSGLTATILIVVSLARKQKHCDVVSATRVKAKAQNKDFIDKAFS